MLRICIQAPAQAEGARILHQLHKKLGLSVDKPKAHSSKEKISFRGQKVLAERQYNRQKLHWKCAQAGEKLYWEEGVLVVRGLILNQNELYLECSLPRVAVYMPLLQALLKSYSCTLVEPDIINRFRQENTAYNPSLHALTDKSELEVYVREHLLWQIYAVSGAWQRFLLNPQEKNFLRQLRVKVRRLRSTLSFFKPVLVASSYLEWQGYLRKLGLELSRLRELDVALMSLEKMDESKKSSPKLAAHFTAWRQQELEHFKGVALMEQINLQLLALILYLQGKPVPVAYQAKSVRKFLQQRHQQWLEKTLSLGDSMDWNDMVATHQLRIRIKKYRYVLMSLPELSNGRFLVILRLVKRLQDVLGFLHDQYINEQLVGALPQDQQKQMQMEIATFTGWEVAKADSYKELAQEAWRAYAKELRQ